MAVTVFDTVKNQWYVQRVNGKPEACHNAATAKTLCRQYTEEEDAARREMVASIPRTEKLQEGEVA
jgi:hypothetical protein